jgi:hypothetical protein
LHETTLMFSTTTTASSMMSPPPRQTAQGHEIERIAEKVKADEGPRIVTGRVRHATVTTGWWRKEQQDYCQHTAVDRVSYVAWMRRTSSP